MDYTCVPQQDKVAQAHAIASLASYVSMSRYFFVLAGAWVHADDGSVRDKRAWGMRGWCKLECTANALSVASEQKPLIVVESDMSVITYGTAGLWGRGWLTSVVGEGAFTVEADRTALGPTVAALIADRKRVALARGTASELLWYRVLHACTRMLLRGTGYEDDAEGTEESVQKGPRGQEDGGLRRGSMEEWLTAMRFSCASPGEAERGPCPLFLAVWTGRVDLVTALLDAGADPNERLRSIRGLEAFDMWEKGMNALHAAALCKSPNAREMVALLLRRGASHQHRTSVGLVPLAIACAVGNIPAIDALLAHDGTPKTFLRPCAAGFPPAAYAIEAGSVAAFHHLRDTYPALMGPYLATGRPDTFQSVGDDGTSFFQHALVLDGDVRMLRALIDVGGIPIDRRTRSVRAGVGRGVIYYVSALRCALQKHPPQFFQLWARMGGPGGSSSAHMAAFFGNLGALKLFILEGVDVNARAMYTKQVPLHVAAHYGHVELARELIAAGAKTDVRDAWGRSPGQVAARYGHLELARELGGRGYGKGGGQGGGMGVRVSRPPARVLPASGERTEVTGGEAPTQMLHSGNSASSADFSCLPSPKPMA